MKKKNLTLIFTMCIFLLAGCAKDSNIEYEVIEQTEESSSLEETAETEKLSEELLPDTAEESVVDGRITYSGDVYSWQEISIIIPESWQDNYFVKEEANGFSIFQTASNQKNENMGFLCGVYRSNQFSNAGTGETLAAYTEEGVLYYVMRPTDVTCYLEDEAILAEYSNMMGQVDWIAGSLLIAGEQVHYDANQYVLPVSSVLALEEYQLMNLTDNELWIARNEIYARHGKIFKNAYLNTYFNSCSWYEPKEGKTDISERELNQIEIDNLKKIVAAEELYAREHPYPKQYVAGKEQSIALTGDGTEQKVCYQVTVSDDYEYAAVLTIDGKEYDLADYITLVTPVQDVYYVTDIAGYEAGLEIAILDDGWSADPVTHFFRYDGKLRYIGEVYGYPFDDYGNNHFNGFTGQNTIMAFGATELIESAFVEAYYRYDMEEGKIVPLTFSEYWYTWFDAHELYVDMPVYSSKNEDAPTLQMKAHSQVFFIKTDCKEWILVRSKDGTEGYIRVKDGIILNIGLPAEEVFSELYFFG